MPEPEEKREAKAPRKKPRETASWVLQRLEPSGKWERCSFHQDGMRVDHFIGEPADMQVIGNTWGSGRYRIQSFDADKKSKGWSSAKEIDDPARPPRDLYAGRPEPEAPPPPPAAPPASNGLGGLEQLLGSGAGTALALMTFMRNAEAEARARSDAEAERRHARLMAEYEQRSIHQARMHQAELEASDRRANATIEQNRVFMQSMFQLHTASQGRQPDDDEDEDDDEPRNPVQMFEAAFDAIGLDAAARKQIAPGIVGLARKFGGGGAAPTASSDGEEEAAE